MIIINRGIIEKMITINRGIIEEVIRIIEIISIMDTKDNLIKICELLTKLIMIMILFEKNQLCILLMLH